MSLLTGLLELMKTVQVWKMMTMNLEMGLTLMKIFDVITRNLCMHSPFNAHFATRCYREHSHIDRTYTWKLYHCIVFWHSRLHKTSREQATILQPWDIQSIWEITDETYRIAGKFSGEFNLAVWRLARAPPNFIPAKFYIRQNFVGCHLTVERTSERVKTEWLCTSSFRKTDLHSWRR